MKSLAINNNRKTAFSSFDIQCTTFIKGIAIIL